jgi:hypothetical protein
VSRAGACAYCVPETKGLSLDEASRIMTSESEHHELDSVAGFTHNDLLHPHRNSKISSHGSRSIHGQTYDLLHQAHRSHPSAAEDDREL